MRYKSAPRAPHVLPAAVDEQRSSSFFEALPRCTHTFRDRATCASDRATEPGSEPPPARPRVHHGGRVDFERSAPQTVGFDKGHTCVILFQRSRGRTPSPLVLVSSLNLRKERRSKTLGGRPRLVLPKGYACVPLVLKPDRLTNPSVTRPRPAMDDTTLVVIMRAYLEGN